MKLVYDQSTTAISTNVGNSRRTKKIMINVKSRKTFHPNTPEPRRSPTPLMANPAPPCRKPCEFLRREQPQPLLPSSPTPKTEQAAMLDLPPTRSKPQTPRRRGKSALTVFYPRARVAVGGLQAQPHFPDMADPRDGEGICSEFIVLLGIGMARWASLWASLWVGWLCGIWYVG